MKLFLYISLLLCYLNAFSQFKKLTIISKDSLENKTLQKLKFSAVINSSQLFPEIDSINKQLKVLGYLQSVNTSIKKNDSIIIINYQLGKPIKYIRINTIGNIEIQNYIKEQHLKTKNTHLIIPFMDISTFMGKIVSFYSNNGFPFVKVNLSDQEIQDDFLNTNLNIDKSNYRTIDRVLIRGYDKFPQKYIRNHFLSKKKKVFNLNNVNNLSSKIQALQFVSEVKKPQISFQKDSTLIYVYLKKQKINQFDGVIGFNSEKDSEIVFNGYLNLELNNVFDKGEELNLQWQSLQNKNKQLDIGAKIPYIFKSKFSPDYRFTLYSQDSSFVTLKSKLIINYSLNYKNNFGILFEKNSSENLLKKSTSDFHDFNTLLYGLQYNYHELDNSIFYRNKLHLHLSVMYGRQEQENTTVKNNIQIVGEYLYTINLKNKIYIKNSSKLNFSENYYQNELEKVGGNTTLRGFPENSILATKYNLSSLEYNYLLNPTTSIYTNADYVILKNDLSKTTNTLYSIGLGYKTQLKHSIINLNYSVGITENKVSVEDASLHISFITLF